MICLACKQGVEHFFPAPGERDAGVCWPCLATVAAGMSPRKAGDFVLARHERIGGVVVTGLATRRTFHVPQSAIESRVRAA